jgi:hypothetical protein
VIHLQSRRVQREPPKYGNQMVRGLTEDFLYDNEEETAYGEWLPSEKRARRLADTRRQVRFDLYAADPNRESIKLKHYCRVDFLVAYLAGGWCTR